jgi:hypothetical protein
MGLRYKREIAVDALDKFSDFFGILKRQKSGIARRIEAFPERGVLLQ